MKRLILSLTSTVLLSSAILFLTMPLDVQIHGEEANVWQHAGIPASDISLLAVSGEPGNEAIYAVAADGRIFKSIDQGNTWTSIPNTSQVDELVINPHNPDDIWQVTDSGEVYRLSDDGTTWDKVIDPADYGFRFSSIYALATPKPEDPDVFLGSDRGTIYALENGVGIFKSTDSGKGWTFLESADINYTHSIVVHPLDSDIVYSGYSRNPLETEVKVMRSLDGGETWQRVFEMPGEQTMVAIDPSDVNIVYIGLAATSEDGGGAIFKSTDKGETWTRLNDQFNMCTVWGQPQLIVDPNEPFTAYAATWLGGTWKTTDAGETWILLEGAPISATALSLNEENTDVIYLADRTTPTVWKSSDGGKTWQKVADFSSDGALLVMRVMAHGDTVYAATFLPQLLGGNMYKSTDAGETWTDITNGLPKGVLDIAVDPANPDNIYVTTNVNYAYKSTDGGDTWEKIANFPDIGAYDIEVDPFEPNILYTSARGGSLPDWFTEIAGDFPDGIVFTEPAGVYKSTDYGATWSNILTTSASCRVIRQHPDNRDALFAVDLIDGLMVSTDGGDSWANYDIGLGTQVLTSAAVNGDKIYVGSQGCGVYSGDIDMTDWSITWQAERSNKPVPDVFNLMIKVDIENPDRIFVSSYPGGLYRTDNGGIKWTDKNGITPSVVVDDPLRLGYYTYAAYPKDTEEMWLGTWGKGIYVSFNAMMLDVPAGLRGKHINMIMVADMAIHMSEAMMFPPPIPKRIFVATEEGIFLSEDGGDSWQDFSNGLGGLQVRTLARTCYGDMFCGTLGYGIYRYDMGQNRWLQVNDFGNIDTTYQYTSMLFHPQDPNVIYLGTSLAGVYKSTDGGQSWREINVGFPNDGVFTMVFHPNNPDIIYVGTSNGIYRSSNSGDLWEAWNNGWPAQQKAASIEFDPENPDIIYACSIGSGDEANGQKNFVGMVMKSTDGGASWFPITNGLDTNQEFYEVIIDRYDSNILYLATQSDGVFISYDGGACWIPWNEGLTELIAGGYGITNPMVLSADGEYLFFATKASGVFRRLVSAVTPTPTPTTPSPTPTITPTPTPTDTTTPTPTDEAGADWWIWLIVGLVAIGAATLIIWRWRHRIT